MKNTTNWQLYNVTDSDKSQKKSEATEIEDKELIRKLKLVEKAFR